MAFQFLCPQGHLLEGEEAHMGLMTQCPYCGIAFYIPTVEPTATAVEPSPLELYSQPYEEEPEPEMESFVAPEPPVSAEAGEPAEAPVEEPPAPAVLHIPCPHGHPLEAPLEMLDQRVKCPHCGTRFVLRRRDSVEYRLEQEQREKRRSRLWLQCSITAAVLVFLGLFVMLVMTMSS